MALVRDPDDVRVTHAAEPEAGAGDAANVVPFKRRLVWPSIILGAAEVVLVAMPLWTLFDLGKVDRSTLLRVALPVVIGAVVVWMAAMTSWLVPIGTAVIARRKGEKVP